MSFTLAVIASGWLWQRYGLVAQGVGEVDSPRVDVTSPTAGLVLSLPHQNHGQWMVYDHVQAGEIIARLEDQQLESRKNLLRQEASQLLDELKERQLDAADEGADPVASKAIRSAWQYEETRLQSLGQELTTGAEVALDDHHNQIPAPSELSEAISAATRQALAQFRETRRGLELRRDELHLASQSQEIEAPISGTLVAVHCWPGQTVPPGGLIATIAADYGRNIIGYIPEESALVARPGMQVTLRTREAGSLRLTSEIEQVGRQVERIPSHQRAISTTPQWGTPVRIKMPSEAVLRPGALVDVVFDSSSAR